MHLVLFFTRGVSLETWATIGSIEREIAIYLWLQDRGVKVTFITYGGPRDLNYTDQLQGIEILCNRGNLSQGRYEKLLPWLHAKTLRQASVLKTNQTNGGEIALRAARLWRKPLVARCGYMWADLANSRGEQDEAEHARQLEGRLFSSAQRVVVTTARMKNYVSERYSVPAERVKVIPNYVLTDDFSPGNGEVVKNQICYVGRLGEEKNLFALVEACEGLDVELMLIGEGSLRAPLLELARKLNLQIIMPGNLLHHQLPEKLRQSSIFVLVSPHEGHPKSLIEAMSCGIAVLGADSPGIREEIDHSETGWLCGMDVESIRAGIRQLLDAPVLRAKLGENARRYILENYALEEIAESEYQLLLNVAKDGKL